MKPEHLLQTILIILVMILCVGFYYTRTNSNEALCKKTGCHKKMQQSSTGSANDFIFMESFSHLITFAEPK